MLIFYMTASEAEYPLILLLWNIVRGYNYIATVCYAAAHTVIVAYYIRYMYFLPSTLVLASVYFLTGILEHLD